MKSHFSFALGTVLTLVSAPVFAAETSAFPAQALGEKAEAALRVYMDSSRATLRKLDALAQDGSAASPEKPRWMALCDAQQSGLAMAEKRALAAHIVATRQKSWPEPVQKWLAQEKAAWQNIESIGGQIIGLHDQLINITNDIQTQHHPALKKRKASLAQWGKMADQTMLKIGNKIVPVIDSEAARALDEILKAEAKLSPSSYAMMRLLLSTEKEIDAFDAELRAANYEARLNAAFARKIDPDARGVFYEHERRWESATSNWLDRYQAAYRAYKTEATPVLNDTIYGYSVYLRGSAEGLPARIKARFAGWRKQIEERDARAKTEAEIDEVILPRTLAPGKSVQISAKIENIGAKNIGSRALKFTCTVAQSPDPKVRTGTHLYSILNANTIAPKTTWRTLYTVAVPATQGDWAYEWTLFEGSKELDKHTIKFKVAGEKRATLSATSVPRSMKTGRESEIEVTIKNSGATTIESGELSVTCSAKRAPSGTRIGREDFAFEIPLRQRLEPGDTAKLEKRLKPPAAPGYWDIELRLELDGRVLEKDEFSVRVE